MSYGASIKIRQRLFQSMRLELAAELVARFRHREAIHDVGTIARTTALKNIARVRLFAAAAFL